MSDAEAVQIPDQDEIPTTTAGAEPPQPEEAEEPIAASVSVCSICSHALAAHTSSARCLVMLGDFGTEGACPCPDVVR